MLPISEPRLSLQAVIAALVEGRVTRNENPALFWVDLGGGTGRAQAEIINAKSRFANYVSALNVDVCERRLRQKYRRKPDFMCADATTVQLPAKAGLITCQFSLPYWHNPLLGVVNAYNQLEDGGLLNIGATSRYRWSRGIRDPKDDRPKDFPMTRVLQEFAMAGVPYATKGHISMYGDNARSLQQFHQLYIKKIPSTSMVLDATVESISQYPPSCYRSGAAKIVTYRSDTAHSPIRVIKQ